MSPVERDVLKKLVDWIPVAWELRSVFSGDKKAALAAIRQWEMDERKKRDERMGR